MCSFNSDAFLEISSRIMDLDANKELCKVNTNSRPGSFLEFRFVNNKFQRADANVSSVTRKEKQ